MKPSFGFSVSIGIHGAASPYNARGIWQFAKDLIFLFIHCSSNSKMYLVIDVWIIWCCRTCEICGSTARNVVGIEDEEVVEEPTEGNTTITAIPEERNSWPRHRLLNVLLACIVFAFVISWLFHFSFLSWAIAFTFVISWLFPFSIPS